MRNRLLAASVVLALHSMPAHAWFFQPPPETVSDETLARFQEAAVTALDGLALIHAVLLKMEQDEIGINSIEEALAAEASLRLASELFGSLQTEDLQLLDVSLEAVAEIDDGARELVDEMEIETAADFARYSGEQCLVIADLLVGLRDLDFGPEVPASIQGRSTINNLAAEISNMLIIANTISGALAFES